MNRLLRWYDHLGLNSYWLGINLATGIITPVLLPYLVVLFMPPEQKNTHLATVRVIGLAAAMLAQPIFGMLSDRSTSRFGRRRPYLFGGALASAAFVGILALSPRFLHHPLDAWFHAVFGVTTAYAVLVAGVALWQLSSNAGQAAAQALIPDLVPEDQRGRSSGFKSVLELLPSFLVILVGPLVDRGRLGWVAAIIAAGYLLTAAVTLRVARETPRLGPRVPLRAGPFLRILALTAIFVGVTQAAVALVRASGAVLARLGAAVETQVALMGLAGLLGMAGSIFIGVYLGAWAGIGAEARLRQSFIWWVINRLLFLAAAGSVQGFAQFYLRDVLRAPNPATLTTILFGVVGLFLVPSAMVGGALADRLGRKRLVFYAGWVAAAGALALLFARGVPLVILSGCIIGAGTGVFFAANWALGTLLVPPGDAGRYLGISNLAGAGAGIVGAGIGGPMADFFNALQPGLGYTVIFAIYAALFVIASLTLLKVKEPGVTTL